MPIAAKHTIANSLLVGNMWFSEQASGLKAVEDSELTGIVKRQDSSSMRHLLFGVIGKTLMLF